MADQEEHTHETEEDIEDNRNYKPPPPKPLTEIVQQDAEDLSLCKYKETLLGGGLSGPIIHDEKNPKKVIVQKLALLVEGRDEVFIDLTKPLDEIKKQSFTMKEGCKYQIKIYFYVQRDIVVGLRYQHKISRIGITGSTMNQMMGSYPPKPELQSYTAPVEDAPSGMMARGDYKVKSLFTDDDKNIYLSWEWNLAVKKDWD